jgi:dihydropteroate synthase
VRTRLQLGELARPTVVGIVNVTPDSFSDGGLYFEADAAIAHGRALRAQGAAILDVGGESTRPGSDPVPIDEELRRVLSVVEALAGEGLTVSIDTRRAEVAQRALDAGAAFVNDVSALRHDPEMAAVVADADVPVCLMHMLGEPKTMQDDPRYGDVLEDVARFLEERLAAAVDAGVREQQVCLDPGIGFGKTLEHNLALLRGLPRLCAIGRPVMVGASRKRFLGTLAGRERPSERVAASVGAAVLAYLGGATLLRVHDVAPTVDALAVAAAVAN